VVLVHAEPVEALRLGELQLVEELVVEAAALLRVEEAVRRVHPDRPIPPLEVLREEAVRHQVEEANLHLAVREIITRLTHGVSRSRSSATRSREGSSSAVCQGRT